MQKDVVWWQEVVSDFLNDLLSDFQKLTEISRELVLNIAHLCLLLIFIATSSTFLSRRIYTLLAFIDSCFFFPIIHSSETLKIQEALQAVVQSEHCIRLQQSYRTFFGALPETCNFLDYRQSFFVSCLQYKGIYTIQVPNIGIAAVVH